LGFDSHAVSMHQDFLPTRSNCSCTLH